MQPYPHVAPQVGTDVLIAEQVHHQNQIHNNAIRVFLTSRKYARSLTKSNIRVPMHQKLTDLPYDASDKCLQITMSRILKAHEITEKSKERLQKMQDRMKQQIESNTNLMNNLKKDKKWIKIKHSRSHSHSHTHSHSHSHSSRIRGHSGHGRHSSHRYSKGRGSSNHNRSHATSTNNNNNNNNNDRRIQTVNRNKNSIGSMNMNISMNSMNSMNRAQSDPMSSISTRHTTNTNGNDRTPTDNSGYYINGRRIYRHRSSVYQNSSILSESPTLNTQVLNQLKAAPNISGNGTRDNENKNKSRFGNFGSKS